MPPLPPPERGSILRQLLPVAAAELVLVGLMLGVYAALGYWSGKVLLGALLGTAAELVNFTVMTLSLLRAENADTPAKGQLSARGNYLLRMAVLLVVLVLALKSGRFDPLATLLPLCFMRIAIYALQFIPKKKEVRG